MFSFPLIFLPICNVLTSQKHDPVF